MKLLFNSGVFSSLSDFIFFRNPKHTLVREIYCASLPGRVAEYAKLNCCSSSHVAIIAINVRQVACQRPGLFPHNPQTRISLNSVVLQSAIVASPKIHDIYVRIAKRSLDHWWNETIKMEWKIWPRRDRRLAKLLKKFKFSSFLFLNEMG